jgi:signal transduction histidine kinase
MTWTQHLYDVAHVFESTLEAEVRVRRVLELTSRLMPCDRMALFDLRATLTPSLLFVPELAPNERPALRGRIAEIATLLREDVVLDHRVIQIPGSLGGTAHLAVPLVSANEVFGVIYVESAASVYDDKHLRLLSVVAGQVASYLTLLRCERTFAQRSADHAAVVAELQRSVGLHDGVFVRLVALIRRPLDAAGLERVARQLDDLGRIRAGHNLAAVRAPVDLAQICGAVLAGIEARHPGASVGVATLGDPRCHGDAGRLAQVVTELAENAIHHGERPLVVAIDGRGSDVVLRAHDEGVIAEERRATIFDPPPAVVQPAARPVGLGLGLLIARQIVIDHGGTVELVSSDDERTTFIVRLPRGIPPT